MKAWKHFGQGFVFALGIVFMMGMVAAAVVFNAGGGTIENLGTPVNDADAATKAYVDTASGGATYNIENFTSSGTFTVPAGVYWVTVTAVGGGGGGGLDTISGDGGGGGGGGEVRYKEHIFLGSTPPSNVTVTVGTGGTGRIVSTGDGTAGGTTTFGSYLTAVGGSRGTRFGDGGAGGGDLGGPGVSAETPGNDGNFSSSQYSGAYSGGGSGGGGEQTGISSGWSGGDSPFATGGAGSNDAGGGGASYGDGGDGNAWDGTPPGIGGGGGGGDFGDNGQDGGDGIVIIEWWS